MTGYDEAALTFEEANLFLSEEAAILDEWRLDDWLALFTEDARYLVPATTLPNGVSPRDVVFIDDGVEQLHGRIERLKSRHAHREYPSSRTRRLITNVRVLSADDTVVLHSNFVVYRMRNKAVAAYVGRYEHQVVRDPQGGLLIAHRKAVLDNEYLDEHGAVSIIL